MTVVASDRMLIPPVKLNFSVSGGEDVSHLITDLTITMPWAGKASASATFMNYDSDIASDTPFLVKPASTLGYGHHSRGLIDSAITADTPPTGNLVSGITNSVAISLEVAGIKSKGIPAFLGGGWQDNYPTGTWPLHDYTYFLDIDNQFMDDITAADRGPSAHTTARAIANRYGIAGVDMRFGDYGIRQLRRDSGTPRTWLGKICRTRQAAMRFRGSTLVMEPFALNNGGNFWLYEAGKNFESFSWAESDPPPSNMFVLNRLDPQQGIIGKQSCIGKQCPGRTISLSFNPPTQRVRVKSTVTEGAIKDWVFVDVNDVYTPTYEAPAHSSPAGITQAIATYYPNFKSVTSTVGQQLPATYTPGYTLLAYGGDAPGSSFTDTFQKVFQDDTTLPGFYDNTKNKYGIWKDFSNLEDPIVPDSATLIAYGNAVLLESIRKVYTGTLKTKTINPLMEPGHWVMLKAPLHGMSRWTAPGAQYGMWFVEAVKYVMVKSGWMMELTLTKGLW